MNKAFNCEILSVGTELLLGHVANTDARDVSRALTETGINVRWHTVVGDNPARLRECVELAKSRADIIITTGGLGPTCDDITKQTLAEAFSLRLLQDENELACREARRKYSRNPNDKNFQEIMLPEGCTVFHNSCGTAPGCVFEKDGKIVAMLPGPPKECRAMLKESLIPYLKKLSNELIISHTVHVFGMGEGKVDSLLREEMSTMTNPSMAPYANECDCFVKITAKASDVSEAEALIAPALSHVQEKLGEVVYGVDVENLEQRALQLLKEKGLSFSAAESCTGGDVAKRFTDVPGASSYFLGGLVTYTNGAKAKLLGIDPALIEEKGAVSYEVAKEMAERVRLVIGTDIGVGVTGLAGPDGDGVNPVGTVYVSMAVEGQSWIKRLDLGPHHSRSYIRHMAGNHIFDMLRRYLTGLPVM